MFMIIGTDERLGFVVAPRGASASAARAARSVLPATTTNHSGTEQLIMVVRRRH